MGSTFSLHFPPLQVRTSLPTSLNPSWQMYLALDRPMFIAILMLFGGFLRSLRRRPLHRLSFPATKYELYNAVLTYTMELYSHHYVLDQRLNRKIPLSFLSFDTFCILWGVTLLKFIHLYVRATFPFTLFKICLLAGKSLSFNKKKVCFEIKIS